MKNLLEVIQFSSLRYLAWKLMAKLNWMEHWTLLIWPEAKRWHQVTEISSDKKKQLLLTKVSHLWEMWYRQSSEETATFPSEIQSWP